MSFVIGSTNQAIEIAAPPRISSFAGFRKDFVYVPLVDPRRAMLHIRLRGENRIHHGADRYSTVFLQGIIRHLTERS